MERAEFLKQMRSMAEALYDHFRNYYWKIWIGNIDQMHHKYLQKFLGLVDRSGVILSAACGAGRFDGLLMEAGHRVLRTEQSAGGVIRAREHFPIDQFPQIGYEKVGMQEMCFHEEFDGLICMDAMEHISPEDWRGGGSVRVPFCPTTGTDPGLARATRVNSGRGRRWRRISPHLGPKGKQPGASLLVSRKQTQRGLDG
jgi:hypothetical protein